MLDRREFIFGTTAFVVASGFAAGAKKPWWEWKGPDRTAEVVPASGLSREELSALLDRIDAYVDPEQVEEATTLADWRKRYGLEITVRTKSKWLKRLWKRAG